MRPLLHRFFVFFCLQVVNEMVLTIEIHPGIMGLGKIMKFLFFIHVKSYPFLSCVCMGIIELVFLPI